jgi:hypothetical protein
LDKRNQKHEVKNGKERKKIDQRCVKEKIKLITKAIKMINRIDTELAKSFNTNKIHLKYNAADRKLGFKICKN